MPYIEGYLDTLSAAPGQTIRLHASTDATGPATLTITREGSPEQVVLRVDKLDVGQHSVPMFKDEPWRVGPRWPVCWEFTIPADWPSGAYRVELSHESWRGWRNTPNADDFTGYANQRIWHSMVLVVRAAKPASRSRILLQLCTNTYIAYNNWGGKSTYDYNSHDHHQAPRVTTLRPGIGYYNTSLAYWERPFIQWCDREGIALEYAINEDLAAWHKGFDDYRLVLSVGHDEYWSAGMRDNLERFIAKGGNAAFFSGNAVCWQVRFEDNGTTMVAYKEQYKADPLYGTDRQHLLSTLWSLPLLKRPENQLTGVGFPMGGYHRSHGVYMDGSGAFTVRRLDPWVFAGTGLKEGDAFGGADTIVGYECDGCAFVEKGGYPVPACTDGTPASFMILAQAPAFWGAQNTAHSPVFAEAGVSPDGRATLGYYSRGTPGNAAGTVFTAGTTDWSHGLASDRVVQQITRNVITRLCH